MMPFIFTYVILGCVCFLSTNRKSVLVSNILLLTIIALFVTKTNVIWTAAARSVKCDSVVCNI